MAESTNPADTLLDVLHDHTDQVIAAAAFKMVRSNQARLQTLSKWAINRLQTPVPPPSSAALSWGDSCALEWSLLYTEYRRLSKATGWAIKQSVAHKYIDSAELKKNVQYEYTEIQQHTERLVVIMLTVAFIVAIWDIKIFDKLSIWIYTTILIELIATATWFHYTSFRQRSEYLYIVKNIQVITSCLGSLVLFLFYGASKL